MALKGLSAKSCSYRYGQNPPLRAFWFRTFHSILALTCLRQPSEAYRQNPAPTGTDKIALPGPSSSVPLPAIRTEPAPDGPQRLVGDYPLRQVRTETPLQGLLVPYLFRRLGTGESCPVPEQMGYRHTRTVPFQWLVVSPKPEIKALGDTGPHLVYLLRA